MKLKANKIWENEPFSVVDGQLAIEKNEFVSYKKYLAYWYFGMVLPTNILFLLVIAIFILVFGGFGSIFSMLLTSIMIIGFIGKNIYEFKVLRRIKTKMIK